MTSGFTTNNYHYLRCWVILNSDGTKVFQHIFTWGFPRPQSEIKTALFEVPNYTNSRYRSDFNGSQRKLIDDGADLNHFDLGLLYLLLQRICSLPPPSDNIWRFEDPDSLPYLLYQIKMRRNDLAHSQVEITESERITSINLYKSLFDKALELAANTFQIDLNVLNAVKEEINTHITDIETSSEVQVTEIIKEIIVREEADVGLDEKEIKIAQEIKAIVADCKENLNATNAKVLEVGKPAIDQLRPTIEGIQELAKNAGPLISKTVDDVKEIFKKLF